MSFGSLDLFNGGLEGVIGPPRMINGSLLQVHGAWCMVHGA